jgi:Rod binding domain-containing protein
MIPPLSLPATPPDLRGQTQATLMQKAKELETAFLSEMLSFSGLGTASAEFGGGVGEDQFASFLREEQARLMVERGGIGLARTIFESLVSQAREAKDDTA